MIDTIEVELPVAGVREVEVTIGGGPNIVISTTAPLNLTSGWLHPNDGILSYYIGGGWVTQIRSRGYNGIVTFEGNIMTFEGNILTFTS